MVSQKDMMVIERLYFGGMCSMLQEIPRNELFNEDEYVMKKRYCSNVDVLIERNVV